MADIDDFFTKRDKKKKPAAKSKFSVLDTEDIAKQLEATCKVAAVVDGGVEGEHTNVNELDVNGEEAASSNVLPTTATSNQNENQDEEWKPFDSDENKDYSGLRINIQNWKVEDEENNYEETNEDNDRKAACPWGAANLKAKLAKSQEPESVVQEAVESSVEKRAPETTVSEETSKSEPSSESNDVAASTTTTTAATTESAAASTTTGAYIPPALKRQMEAAAAAASSASGGSARSASSATSAAAAAAPAAAPVGKYIPPSMRNRAADDGSLNSSSSSSVAPRKFGKAQPNIMDTFEFPTLDAAAPPSSDTGDKLTNGNSDKFEMAKKGSRGPEAGAKTGKSNTIDLENKFTALEASSNN